MTPDEIVSQLEELLPKLNPDGLQSADEWYEGWVKYSQLLIPRNLRVLLEELKKYQVALGALADIGNARDLTRHGLQSKARRIYEELVPESAREAKASVQQEP